MSFDKSLKLKKFKEAWSFASALDRVDCWQELASAALYHFDIETGIYCIERIYTLFVSFLLSYSCLTADQGCIICIFTQRNISKLLFINIIFIVAHLSVY